MVQATSKPRIERLNEEELWQRIRELESKLYLAKLDERLAREELSKAQQTILFLRQNLTQVIHYFLDRMYGECARYWLIEMGYKLRGRQERCSDFFFCARKRFRVALYTLSH